MVGKIFAFALLFAAIGCRNDDLDIKTKTQLLTGGSSRSWNITEESPEDEDPLCRPSADYAKDNTWTFSADGNFSFDHGAIVGNESCSDIISFTGTWEFTENESKIVVTADPDIGSFQLSGTITALHDEHFIIEDYGMQFTFSRK